MRVSLGADIAEGADVRMIERRDGARFAIEPRPQLLISGELRREHLDRDDPIERVSRAR